MAECGSMTDASAPEVTRRSKHSTWLNIVPVVGIELCAVTASKSFLFPALH